MRSLAGRREEGDIVTQMDTRVSEASMKDPVLYAEGGDGCWIKRESERERAREILNQIKSKIFSHRSPLVSFLPRIKTPRSKWKHFFILGEVEGVRSTDYRGIDGTMG